MQVASTSSTLSSTNARAVLSRLSLKDSLRRHFRVLPCPVPFVVGGGEANRRRAAARVRWKRESPRVSTVMMGLRGGRYDLHDRDCSSTWLHIRAMYIETIFRLNGFRLRRTHNNGNSELYINLPQLPLCLPHPLGVRTHVTHR